MHNRTDKKSGWRRPSRDITVTLALVLVIVLALAFFRGESMSIRAIERPTYPENGNFESSEDLRRLSDYVVDAAYQEAFVDFTIRSAAQIIGGAGSQNQIYSPLSLWFALTLCADSTSGNTSKEILEVLSLGQFQSEWVGQQSTMLFKRLFFENDVGRLKILNSLWLDNRIPFKQDYLKKVAETYFVESNRVNFNNASVYRIISYYVERRTGSKLTDRLQSFFQPLAGNDLEVGHATGVTTALALVNTVSFADEWTERFNETLTTQGRFSLPDGSTATPLFMRNKYANHVYIAAAGFKASGLSLRNGSSMIFVLPDEGETPQSVLANAGWMEQIISQKDQQTGEVVFTIPKFDIESEIWNLSEPLQEIGIKDAFDPNKADFSALSDMKPLWLGRIGQSIRVKIDERGCTADAMLGIRLSAASLVSGQCEMILDRPFIFIILGQDQFPLFIGMVNDPS